MIKLKQLVTLLASIIKGKDLRVSSERQQALSILRRMDGQRKTRYSPKLGEQLTVDSGYQSLEAFIEALKVFNEIVSNDNDVIPANMCDLSIAPVVLDNMFVTRRGSYLNADVVDVFIREAIRLCEQMESAEELEVGAQAHNNRILARVYTSIKNVSNGISQSLT